MKNCLMGFPNKESVPCVPDVPYDFCALYIESVYILLKIYVHNVIHVCVLKL